MDNSNGQNGVIPRLTNWLAHPFHSDMGALDWVLFLGLVLVAIFLWTRVLKHISE